MVETWRSAWVTKDLDAYLGFYAPRFRSDGKGLAEWSVHKKGVFGRAGEIQVSLDELKVEMNGERATVRFIQVYTSGRYRDRGRKRLELRRQAGRWQIVAESFKKL